MQYAMQIDEIRNAFTASYRTHGGINHLDGQNLPCRGSVATLSGAFMRLFFPGYFNETPPRQSSMEEDTGQLLTAVHSHLCVELERCLRFVEHADPGHASADLVLQFMRKMPEVRRLVLLDVEAAYAGDPAARSVEEVIVAYPFVLVSVLQRLAHVMHGLGVPLLPRMLTEYAHERTGCDIHPGARLGPSLFIDHCTGVVIGETAVIGAGVRIYQGVTLGAASFQTDDRGRAVKGVKRHPEIGDDVVIYANATILGGDTRVGARSIIGSNVWLRESVAEDSVVYHNMGSAMTRCRSRQRETASVRGAEHVVVHDQPPAVEEAEPLMAAAVGPGSGT